jgi:hypothetical protein
MFKKITTTTTTRKIIERERGERETMMMNLLNIWLKLIIRLIIFIVLVLLQFNVL